MKRGMRILAAFPDELLSSWISRHAAYYEVPPLVLLQHCLPSARALRGVDLKLKHADAISLARLFRVEPQSIVDMSFAVAPAIAHRMITTQPINYFQKCAQDQGKGTVIRRHQLEGWRLTCPLCGQMLTENSDQTSISPPNLWHLIRHGERLFQAETNGDSIGWASPAEFARLLLMRLVPRPLNVDRAARPGIYLTTGKRRQCSPKGYDAFDGGDDVLMANVISHVTSIRSCGGNKVKSRRMYVVTGVDGSGPLMAPHADLNARYCRPHASPGSYTPELAPDQSPSI